MICQLPASNVIKDIYQSSLSPAKILNHPGFNSRPTVAHPPTVVQAILWQ